MAQTIALWRSIADPFTVPQSIHRCQLRDWELLDCDVAGCTVCGKIHACKDEKCPLICYEGRQVCELTGFCVRNQLFADDEYMDTVAYMPTAHQVVHRTIQTEQIEHWIRAVLCSEKSRDSLEAECLKRASRVKSVFLKLAKQCKAQRQPVNVVHLCALTAHSMANIRTPKLLNRDHLKAIADQCIEAAVFFCRTFLDVLKCTPPAIKMHGFIVGLLYLMRTGMCICENVEIVPRIPELQYVLPSENQVKALFKLSTKIMTEVENIIKMTLRKFTRDQLVAMGFDML
jgi:hypothetical protein